MTALTTEQFKKHFEIGEDCLVLSSQIAMIASFLNYTDFDYQSQQSIIEPTKQYSNVLMSVTDDDKFPNATFGHIKKWLNYAIKFLKPNGILQAKFHPQVILNLIDENIQVNEISIYSDECFFTIQNKPREKNQKTLVSYSTGESLNVNLNHEFVLSSYDEEVYDYIKNIGSFYQVNNITFSGHDVETKLEKTREKANKENKFGLVIYNNIPSLRVEKLEETNVSSGSNCYLFDSEEERNSYYSALRNPKVIALAKNLAYNRTMRIKVQNYLIHPSIFNYAKSV